MSGLIAFGGPLAALCVVGFLVWRRRTLARKPTWLTLPIWPHGQVDIEVPSASRDIVHHVNLAENSCTCERWTKTCVTFPVSDLRRVCRHIAKAIVSRQDQYGIDLEKWALRILSSMSLGQSFGVCRFFESAIFSNGESQFLAIYDTETGWANLYDERGGVYGYSARGNRWSFGEGPEHPLVLKKDLRPWMHLFDEKFKSRQEEHARQKEEQQRDEQHSRRVKQTAENDAAQFPHDLLGSPYRLQDFERIHPGWIQFQHPVSAHVTVVSRTAAEASRQIFEAASGMPAALEGPFFHLKIDGKDFVLSFNEDRSKVLVVFQRPLKKKVDYSLEVFFPNECRWGREGTAPPRLLLVRGLIYDFLHGISLEGDRIDYELSTDPYMKDWETFKKGPLERAPYPPLP